MKVKDLNLKKELDFNPKEGILKLGRQRMVVLPADSIGKLVDFIMDIADENMVYMFLSRMGEEAGRKDARVLKEDFNPDTEQDWIALGPTMHSWEGIVKVIVDELKYDREEGSFHMKGKWKNSFLADQWLKHFGEADEPVCSLLTGYATGYGSEFMGKEMKAKELKCRGQGDDICVWEVKPKGEW